MSFWTLIWRGLAFHARSHIGTLLGVAVGSAILTGALLVGDSVRESLRQLALQRLGKVDVALAGGDRFFRSELADRLGLGYRPVAAPVMQLDATVATPDDKGRANGVQLLGVDERFWRLAVVEPEFPSPAEDEVLLNGRLMRQLGVKPGDVVIVRASRPSSLSRETPLSPQEDSSVNLRLTVAAEVGAEAMGSFGLRPSQLPAMNAFVHLGTLQKRLEMEGRANVLLAGGEGVDLAAVEEGLERAWDLPDAELDMRVLPDRGVVELRSSRVFLEPVVAGAAAELWTGSQPILTMFVNSLRHGGESTPYSMVCAADLGFMPTGMATNEIVLNDWTAEDLGAGVGDEVEVRFYALTTARRLEERSAVFTVRAVVPLSGPAGDPELMPMFPGVEKAESTRDWDPTLPVSMSEIRPKDETYWEEHKGTPKAFVSLAAGQALWSNRFGDLTAVRLSGGGGNLEEERDRKAAALKGALGPGSFGLAFEPVREQALASANQSQDFGGLFIGFSFFLIIAALLLVSLLFQFGVERRAEETGTLLALGLSPRQVRRLWLGEAMGVAIAGSLAGMALGVGYAQLMIRGLATLWRDAVGTSALAYYGSGSTLMAGAIGGAAVALLTIWLALRKQARQPARLLLAGEVLADDTHGAGQLARGQTRRGWLAAGLLGGGLLLAVQAVVRGETTSAGTFFGAGSMALLGGMAAAGWWFTRLRIAESGRELTLVSLGVRNASRRRGRSLSIVGLLASGCFLVAAIGVFRLDAVRDASERSAGTGGFALVGEATFPVIQDLNTQDGLDFYALDEGDLQGATIVPLRVRDGDEASCLNLNRARTPRLLGVDAEALASRGAFSFAKVMKGADRGEGWRLLLKSGGDAVVPAVGDLNSILWAMGRKVGDVLDYTDEQGRTFKVQLVGAVANSILQGNLLIDEQAFLERFPSEPGFRMFLVDADEDKAGVVREVLTEGLSVAGVEFSSTAERLNAFNAVQNTYLGTFQLLGGLGVILGSFGLGVVVLRNVLERRGELALMLAVGFERSAVGRVVLVEHAGLLLAGLFLGVGAALLAVLPSVLSPSGELPVTGLGLTLGAVLVSGWVWTWFATRAALRGRLLDGLRNE
ncbi:MAG: hypothetical protein RI897_4615 [Verrucomicrobiota bacterium]